MSSEFALDASGLVIKDEDAQNYVENFIAKMRDAAAQDLQEFAAGRPMVKKLFLLPQAVEVMQKYQFMDAFITFGHLDLRNSARVCRWMPRPGPVATEPAEWGPAFCAHSLGPARLHGEATHHQRGLAQCGGAIVGQGCGCSVA